MRKIQAGNSTIFIPDIINGLISERAKVRNNFKKIKPDILTIQASDEEVEGLKRIVEGEDFEYFLSNYEEIYGKKLAKFGEVKVPPPCYEEAMKLCLDTETPLVGIDLDDMLFADIFCESVSGFDLVRHSWRVNRLKRKRFKAETPKEFVLKWDKEINKLKGFRNLESKREEHMARALLRLAKKHERILCIVEMQRADGIRKKVLQGKKGRKDEG